MYGPLIIRLESYLFRGQDKSMRIIQIIRSFDSPCNSLIYSSFYYFGLEQLANSWGSFELISQMAPSLFQIHVLSTLTMSSFALEAREECTGHENPRFLK